MTRAKTVLVVEDEALIRIAVADELEDAGFRVIEADNADQAIQILESELDVWAIFTDIDMPGSMDGLKLAFAVRDRWPPVHIFVTSGHHVVDASMMPDRSQFFSKPCEMTNVIRALRSL